MGGKGPYARFDAGDVATHEAGHVLGLNHTFEENRPLMCPAGDGTTYDCTTSDDGVCDTKPHKRPVTLDEITCGDQPACFNMGVAPVTNFMNYTTDACRNQFTPGQFTRVR